MAESVDVPVSAVPVALEAAIPGAMVGARFTVSNDSESLVLYRVAAAEPALDASGHGLPPYRSESFIVAAGAERSWFWTRGALATLVVTETA